MKWSFLRDREFLRIPLAFVLLFAVLGFALAFSPPPAFTQASCGQAITTSTTLDASLGPCPNDGIVISASNITLNCAGYTITGESNPIENVAGVDLSGLTGVTVENCNVTGFQYGFYISGSSGSTFTGNTANSNLLDGFFLGGSPGNTFAKNTANSNKQYGYYESAGPGTENTYTLDICLGDTFEGSSPGGLCTLIAAGAITPSAPTIDSGRSVRLTVDLYGGTAPYSYQWYTSSDCSTSPVYGATSSTYLASPASVTTYYYGVTDSNSPPLSACSPSPGDTVTVDPALVAGPITPSAPNITLNSDPSGGTGSYAYQWYFGSSSACSSDTAPLGTAPTQFVSPTWSTYYCYTVTDTSTNAPTVASATYLVTVVSPPVTVSSTASAITTTAITTFRITTPPYPTETSPEPSVLTTTTKTTTALSTTTTTALSTTTYATTVTQPTTVATTVTQRTTVATTVTQPTIITQTQTQSRTSTRTTTQTMTTAQPTTTTTTTTTTSLSTSTKTTSAIPTLWAYLALVAAIIVVLALVVWALLRRRRHYHPLVTGEPQPVHE